MADFGFNPGTVTVQQAIIECANRVISYAVNTGRIPGDIANAIMQRVHQELMGLVNYVDQNFIRGGSTFNDNDVTNWLKDLFERWANEMFPQNNNYYCQPQMGNGNYGYNNYGYSVRPQFGSQVNPNFFAAAQYQQQFTPQSYNQYGHTNGMRFDNRMATMPAMGGNPSANSAMMGMGSALGRQAINSRMNQPANAQFAQQNVPNPVEQVAQQYTNAANVQNAQVETPVQEESIPVESVNEVRSIKTIDDIEFDTYTLLMNGIRRKLNERANKLKNVDKITSNDTEIAIGDYVANRVFSKETDTIDNRHEKSDRSTVEELKTSETIECIEHEYSAKIVDREENITTLDIVDVSIPINNATEATEFVKNNVKRIDSSNKFYLKISYDELTAMKVPGDGENISAIFNEISDKVSKFTSKEVYDGVVEYFIEEIMPTIRKANVIGRNYIENLIFNKFNDLFDRYCTVPYNHEFRPENLPKASSISEIIDMSDNKYAQFMYKYYETDYTDAVKRCLCVTLKSIFTNETIDIDSPASKGILAHVDELKSINYGRYRISDYGVMPEDTFNNLLKKIKKDYIVHTTRKSILVTNVNINEFLPDSEYVYISNDARIHEVIFSLVMRMSEHMEDITVITMDDNNRVTSTMKISTLVDGTIFIKRI